MYSVHVNISLHVRSRVNFTCKLICISMEPLFELETCRWEFVQSQKLKRRAQMRRAQVRRAHMRPHHSNRRNT